MELRPYDPVHDGDWDESVGRYETKHLFHTSAWLDFLKESQGGEIVQLTMEESGRTVGLFAGLEVRKGFFRILGSPLPGTTTEYMGPAVDKAGFDLKGFLAALDAYCRRRGVHLLELCNPLTDDPETMQSAGFHPHPSGTFRIPLSLGQDALWQSFPNKFRNQVRKAVKSGVVVEEPKDVAAFLDEYYAQLQKVFQRQGLVPSYSKARLKHLYSHLSGSIVSFWARHEGKTIATGIFPHDDRRAFFFGGASIPQFHHLCPNDLLHWEAMQRFCAMGLKEYDTGGSGSFKAKLGYPFVPFPRYSRYYSLPARLCREAYRLGFTSWSRLRCLLRPRAAS